DPVAGQLEGGGPNEAIETGLGGCVVRQPRIGDARARDGGRHDDSATTGLLEHRECLLGEPESSLEVDRQRAIQQLGIDLLERAQGVETGVVDEDVYTLEEMTRLIHQPNDRIAFRDIRLNRMSQTAITGDLSGGLSCTLLGYVRNCDTRAMGCQRARDCTPYSACGPSDHTRATREIERYHGIAQQRATGEHAVTSGKPGWERRR